MPKWTETARPPPPSQSPGRTEDDDFRVTFPTQGHFCWSQVVPQLVEKFVEKLIFFDCWLGRERSWVRREEGCQNGQNQLSVANRLLGKTIFSLVLVGKSMLRQIDIALAALDREERKNLSTILGVFSAQKSKMRQLIKCFVFQPCPDGLAISSTILIKIQNMGRCPSVLRYFLKRRSNAHKISKQNIHFPRFRSNLRNR